MSGRRLLAAIGALVLLGGCGGDPQPKVEPTPTTASPTATDSGPAKPATAKDVIRQYVELSLEAQATGETSALRDAFQVCKSCLRMADHIDAIYTNGGFIHPGDWSVKEVHLAGHVGLRYEYDLSIVAEPGEYKEDGERVKLSGGPNTFRMIFKKATVGWILRDVQDET